MKLFRNKFTMEMISLPMLLTKKLLDLKKKFLAHFNEPKRNNLQILQFFC